MPKFNKEKNVHSLNYFLLILLWIALPEILFLIINWELERFFLNTVAFFSLFLFPTFLFKNHLRLYAICLLPIVLVGVMNIFCIYYYNMPIVDSVVILLFNTDLQESTELIKGYIWPIIITTIVYIAVYGFLVTKIKDKITSKKALSFSIISLLIILIIPFANNSNKNYKQKLASRYYTIFPISVLYSIKAVKAQYNLLNKYAPIKNAFKFNAIQDGNINDQQIHILVVGESASFYHWTASGYHRKTTPRIDTTSNLYLFNNTHSVGFITEFALPIMLTGIDSDKFEEHSKQKSILSAFAETGFKTYWISTHLESGYIKSHSDEASEKVLITNFDYQTKNFRDDSYLLKQLDSVINALGKKKFIVLHIYGSHYDYSTRYPEKFDVFKPSNKTVFTKATDRKNKQVIINSYDNSILYTDYILDSVIKRVKKETVNSAILYMSDHGENLFDDQRNLSQHSYTEPSKFISSIPFFIWTSDKFKTDFPNKINAIKTNLHKRNSTENLLYTFTDLVGIHHRLSDSTKSLSSLAFKERQTYILGDGFKRFNTDSLK